MDKKELRSPVDNGYVKKVSKGKANRGTIGDLLRQQGNTEFLNNHANQKAIESQKHLFAEIRIKMYAYFWTTVSNGNVRGE
ncbi:MAG: hypothetical protein LBF37_02330 [Rickettsiales bacterium]|jgi:hypothetical protein|nr:hypothetical protein [Rickettsiales bacterium]